MHQCCWTWMCHPTAPLTSRCPAAPAQTYATIPSVMPTFVSLAIVVMNPDVCGVFVRDCSSLRLLPVFEFLFRISWFCFAEFVCHPGVLFLIVAGTWLGALLRSSLSWCGALHVLLLPSTLWLCSLSTTTRFRRQCDRWQCTGQRRRAYRSVPLCSY